MEQRYELHTDLLRCEHCGQHNKLLRFCAACGMARTTILIAQPYDYRRDMQLDFRCRRCHSQRITAPYCIYCDRGMKSQEANYPGSKPPRTDVGLPVRPTMEVYVDGLIRDVYTDTKELVPLEPAPKRLRTRENKFRTKQPVQVVLGRYKNTVFGTDQCFVCGSNRQLTIHHFIPTGKGGLNVKDNRLTTCRPCHDKIHSKERTSKRDRRAYYMPVGDGQLREALETLARQWET
jgi:hypothetical protein